MIPERARTDGQIFPPEALISGPESALERSCDAS
jgi:hypothetical protein